MSEPEFAIHTNYRDAVSRGVHDCYHLLTDKSSKVVNTTDYWDDVAFAEVVSWYCVSVVSALSFREALSWMLESWDGSHVYDTGQLPELLQRAVCKQMSTEVRRELHGALTGRYARPVCCDRPIKGRNSLWFPSNATPLIRVNEYAPPLNSKSRWVRDIFELYVPRITGMTQYGKQDGIYLRGRKKPFEAGPDLNDMIHEKEISVMELTYLDAGLNTEMAMFKEIWQGAISREYIRLLEPMSVTNAKIFDSLSIGPEARP